jgi:hypothetical protein
VSHKRQVTLIAALVVSLTLSCCALWLFTLPELDPTGQQDSSDAMRAMIEGRAVLNTATHWPVTRTGWPFFEQYSPKDAN